MVVSQPLEGVLAELKATEKTPKLLLHCCCAPCASHVLEYLSPFFRITALFFNPNIRPREEYDKRAAELLKLLSLAKYVNAVDEIVCEYDPAGFEAAAAPFWAEPEGGKRCSRCFELRLGETAMRASSLGYEYFTTTLSVGPHKDAELLNKTGADMAEQHGGIYLISDFKKRDGYKRSVELSKQYGLYRQSYCGCKKM